MIVIYDLESYWNFFSFTAELSDCSISWQFEISERRDDTVLIREFMIMLKERAAIMVGFNNIGYDYPMLHYFMKHGCPTAETLKEETNRIINTPWNNRLKNNIRPSNEIVKQLDLFKVHHFDNVAKMTSLKAIEFNMRLDVVEDLPYPPEHILSHDEMDVVLKYNHRDVRATKKFFHESEGEIDMRSYIGKKLLKDINNYSDVKIGKTIIQTRLESQGYEAYQYIANVGQRPKQTPRNYIELARCVPNYITFTNPGFNAVCEWFKTRIITETKGSFIDIPECDLGPDLAQHCDMVKKKKIGIHPIMLCEYKIAEKGVNIGEVFTHWNEAKNLNCNVGGLNYVFGTGGLHASVSDKCYESTKTHKIIDADVKSMYPSISIVNGYYPEHIGPGFLTVYDSIKQERFKHKKGTPMNAGLKLALNGTFGATNDKYSIFYDPLMTMQITITGQLCLAMLCDMLQKVPGIRFIQANTDGVTCVVPKEREGQYYGICNKWEQITNLELEWVDYKSMFIADVNSYLAVTTEGKVKRKGRYDWKVGWHQNASKLIVPKVAEKVLLEGVSIDQTIREWPDIMDFMCRVKVPNNSFLVGKDKDQEWKLSNFTRYYVAEEGLSLVKRMPPLPNKPEQWRSIGVESGKKVCPCNNIRDATRPVNFKYYINEVEKITLPFSEGM